MGSRVGAWFDPAQQTVVSTHYDRPARALGRHRCPSGSESAAWTDDRGGVEVSDLDRRHGKAPQPPVCSDEVRDERRGRVAQHLGGGVVLLQHATLAEHGDPVTHRDRLVDVVGDEDHRLVELCLQAEELLLEPVTGDRVDGAERLVHQQHRRVAGEGAGDADALRLAARQLVRVAAGVDSGVEADQLEQLRRHGRVRAPCPSRAGAGPRHVVGDLQVGKSPACWMT